MRIKQIKIQNYKAFKDAERIEVDSKNLLIYGNNGSGKSSLYFALHALLQSSTKTNVQIQKYFDPTHSENLLNLFVDQPNTSPTTNSYVKIVTDDSAEYQFSPTGNTTGHPTVQLANQASDFINYRLLLGFYNFRNSEEADLFPIFRKEFFPYWTDPQRNINYEEWYQSLEGDELERLKEQRVRRNSRSYKDFERKLDDFNTGFGQRLLSLNEGVNKYLQQDFLSGEPIEVRLHLKEKLRPNQKDKWILDALVVQLIVTYDGKSVNRSHTFLNEGRLTALALSIWLAASDARLKASDLKLLILDDLLISLDMSMRMQVLKIILDKYTPPRDNPDNTRDYQIFILTHDKGFFNILKQNLILKDKNEDKWKILELYENRTEDRYANPIIIESEDAIKKAEKYLKGDDQGRGKDYEACALYLRKKAEELIRIFFDPTLEGLARFQVLENLANSLVGVEKEYKTRIFNNFLELLETTVFTVEKVNKLKVERFRGDGTLTEPEIGEINIFRSSVMRFLENYYQHREQKKQQLDDLLTVVKKVNETRDRVLNLGAHHTYEPLYGTELALAIKTLKEFEEAVKDVSTSST